MKNKLLGTLIIASLLLAGCGGGNDDTDTGGPGSGGSGTATALEGTWIKSCGIGAGEDSTDPGALYDEVTLKYTGNNFDSSIKNYSDSGCTSPFTPAPNPTSDGTFTVGDTVTTTGGIQATEIDSHITQFNGAPFDVNDFTIFSIDKDTLYLGIDTGSKDASTATLRHDTLDFVRIFIRQ